VYDYCYFSKRKIIILQHPSLTAKTHRVYDIFGQNASETRVQLGRDALY